MEAEVTNILNKNVITTVYCHFSFRRPKNKSYGLFAVAFYLDFEGKKLCTYVTRRLPLWENHQFITAVQAYEHALYTIYTFQGKMRAAGIKNVMLVTDNTTLAGWIENPSKNRHYKEYMEKAVSQFRAGAPKEITMGLGLCEVRDYEKSYKFCKEEFVKNDAKPIVTNKNTGKKVIDLAEANLEYKTITQLAADDINKPEIIGM
jgi:hypothetical protein